MRNASVTTLDVRDGCIPDADYNIIEQEYDSLKHNIQYILEEHNEEY